MNIINFGGFYGEDSEHGNCVYNAVAMFIGADDDEGNIDYEKVENSGIDFKIFYELYSKELVKLLNLYIKREYGFDFNAEYVSLCIQKEYNFETDYILANIPYESLLELDRKLRQNKNYVSYFNNTRAALEEDKNIYNPNIFSDILTYYLFHKTKMYETFFADKIREFIKTKKN